MTEHQSLSSFVVMGAVGTSGGAESDYIGLESGAALGERSRQLLLKLESMYDSKQSDVGFGAYAARSAQTRSRSRAGALFLQAVNGFKAVADACEVALGQGEEQKRRAVAARAKLRNALETCEQRLMEVAGAREACVSTAVYVLMLIELWDFSLCHDYISYRLMHLRVLINLYRILQITSIILISPLQQHTNKM